MRRLPEKFDVRPTVTSDAIAILKDLRQYEKQSLELLNVDPVFALKSEIEASAHCFTGFSDGKAGVIWGVKPPSLLSDTAYLWAITTPLVDEHPFVFARHSQEFIKLILKSYPKLTGYVQQENKRSKRWLRWLGFTIEKPQDYKGRQVCYFERRA